MSSQRNAAHIFSGRIRAKASPRETNVIAVLSK